METRSKLIFVHSLKDLVLIMLEKRPTSKVFFFFFQIMHQLYPLNVCESNNNKKSDVHDLLNVFNNPEKVYTSSDKNKTFS